MNCTKKHCIHFSAITQLPEFICFASTQSTNDYYPFGSPLPNRGFDIGIYKFGFNGKEKDDLGDGDVCQYDYGFRIYDPRIARFLSIDPLFSSYPWYTPYQFSGNKPVWAIDLDGLEELIVSKPTINDHTVIKINWVYSNKRKIVDPHGKLGVDYIDQNGNATRQGALNPRSVENVLYTQFCVDYYIKQGDQFIKKHGPIKDALGNIRTLSTSGDDGNGFTRWTGWGAEILKEAKVFFQNAGSTVDAAGMQSTPQERVAEQLQNLNEIGAILQNNSSAQVILIGYTDKDSSEDYNDNLSLKRVTEIKNYLMENFDIGEDRFTIDWKGEDEADQSQKNPENRKVEISVFVP